jgi:membrane-bound ClpP family serine protease
VALILGLFGTAQLPVNAAGVVLFGVAVVLFILELKVGGHAVFGVGGVAALVASGLLLFNTGGGPFSIDVPVVIVAAALLGGLLLFAVSKAVEARHGPVSTGWEEMIGREGVVRVALDPVGQIFTQGALWRARPTREGITIPVGARVRVDSVEGLTLYVSPAPAPEQSEEKEESPAWG